MENKFNLNEFKKQVATEGDNISSDETNIIPLTPAPDHDPRFDIEQEVLKKANDIMAGKASKVVDENVVKKGDVITHKRTRREYALIWEYFLEKEEPEFKTKMGYGAKEIKRIGINKFIDYMDWRTKEDISKWKTDNVNVIPCQQCGVEYTTFQLDLGLCTKCKNDYDFKRFYEMVEANEKVNPGSTMEIISMFVFSPEFRENYKMKSRDIRVKEAIEADFEGMDSYRLLADIAREGQTTDEFFLIVEREILKRLRSKKRKNSKIHIILDHILKNKAEMMSSDDIVGALKKYFFEEVEA